MNDLVPHPIASVLFGLAVVAFFLWPVSEENQLAKRSAQSLSRLGIQIHSASERLLLAREKAEADRLAALKTRDEKPKPATKTYYRVTVPDSGTLEAGEVVIKLDGIVARPADAQCQDEKGKSWSCGAAAKAALRRLAAPAPSSARCPRQPSRSRSRRAVPSPAPTSPPGWCGKGGRSPTIQRSLRLLMRPGQRSPSVSAFGVELNSRWVAG